MNMGDVVGQLMREGLSPATQDRLQHAVGRSGLGGLGDALNSVLGGNKPGSADGGLGGLLGSIGGALSANSGVGGLSRGELGGLGALAGALLGGGGSAVKGAVGGSAMAILGTLAISALRNWQQESATSASDALAGFSQAEAQQMTAPETAELCLRGMIEAVKSDGTVSTEEIERILGKLQDGGITPEERGLVTEYLNGPPNVRGLVAAIPNREVGAQVYAAALMAIAVDTQAERRFLAELAQGAGLDEATVGRLHAMVGAPSGA